MGDDLRLHRHVLPGAAFFHQLEPALHALLRLFEEALVLGLQQRQQSVKDGLGIADQADIRRVAQADARGIDVDLHALRLSGFGQELHVGIAGADHEEGVALFHRIDRWRCAEQAETAGGVGAAIRNDRLAEQGFDDGAAYGVGKLGQLFTAAKGAAPGEDGDLAAVVDQVRGFAEENLRRQGGRRCAPVAAVAFDVAVVAMSFALLPILNVFGDADVADAAASIGGANGHVNAVDGVRRPHDALVEFSYVHVELVEIDVLLIVHADEVVEGVAGDGEDWLQVALGIVQAVEEMHAAGARGRAADADSSGVFGVAAGSKGGRLFVPNLNELQLVLVCAQRFEEAVDTIPGIPEDGIHTPFDQPFNDQVGNCLCHLLSPLCACVSGRHGP